MSDARRHGFKLLITHRYVLLTFNQSPPISCMICVDVDVNQLIIIDGGLDGDVNFVKHVTPTFLIYISHVVFFMS